MKKSNIEYKKLLKVLRRGGTYCNPKIFTETLRSK